MTLKPDESRVAFLSERYNIQQQLSKRAGRQTLLAQDLHTKEPVVIKLLHLGKDFQWQDLKLFEREAKTLQSLSHPAIPCYLDYFDVDQPAFKGFALVQSYISGKSLETHLKTGRTFTEAEVKKIAKSLLDILIYLHQQSPPIIHRDIKPSNILLGDTLEEIYLVDFGSVQHLAAKEGSTITVVGTYGYMPLEQFGGRITSASDLYSLAATLIYLVTGRHPADLSDQNSRIQFRHTACLSSEFADWLEWLTEPAIDRRPNSAQAALHALENPIHRQSTSSDKDLLIIKRPSNSDDITCIKTARFFEVVTSFQGVPDTILIVCLAVCATFGAEALYGWWADQVDGVPLYGGQIVNGNVIDIDFMPVTFLVILIGGFPAALFFLAVLRKLLYKIRLRVDRQSIKVARTFLGLKLRQRCYPIAQTPFWVASTELSAKQQECCTHWLFEKVGEGVAYAEAKWLAYEIANWLDRDRS